MLNIGEGQPFKGSEHHQMNSVVLESENGAYGGGTAETENDLFYMQEIISKLRDEGPDYTLSEMIS